MKIYIRNPKDFRYYTQWTDKPYRLLFYTAAVIFSILVGNVFFIGLFIGSLLVLYTVDRVFLAVVIAEEEARE